MAISTQEYTLGKRRFMHAAAAANDASVYRLTIEFWKWLAEFKGKPDLQVIEFDNLIATPTIIADAACSILCIVLKKATATAAWFKASDSATAVSATAGEITLKQAAIKTDVLFFPKGNAMANGFTIGSETTAAGSTTSAAGDGASGVVLLAAPGF